MNDKYKITPAQVFKLRMQYKAEFNNLRKTYHEVVLQKSPHQKKHFYNKFANTSILPDTVSSRQKQTYQRKHFYSPVNISQTLQRSCSRGKKQFDNKNNDNLTNVIRQKYQAKKKSLSQATISKHNHSMINFTKNQSSMTGLKMGLNDKSLTHIPKSCIKINHKYHRFDTSLLG